MDYPLEQGNEVFFSQPISSYNQNHGNCSGWPRGTVTMQKGDAVWYTFLNQSVGNYREFLKGRLN